uniref:Homeobox domain-containing protein n=1 Tax=Aegilops tauschii subsp. strangulata TaxID=200361 RepID=A0A453LDK0_AEGTS
MSFGGMFDGAGSGVFSYDAGGGGPGMHNPGRLLAQPPIPRPAAGAGGGGFASSTGLSLGLTNMEGGGQLGGAFMGSTGSGGDGDSLGRAREDENDSRSGSDNLDGASADELDPDNSNPRKKKKRYHRHTPQQIQELEAVFKECPHPDEKQRMELSRRLNLESRQVKFWFQNRRTQMKTQIERHENALLRQENDKLRTENMTIREAMRSPTCGNCGGAAVLGEVSLEEQHLRIENSRLKDELDRVCALAGKFLGRPVSAISSPLSLPSSLCSGLDLAVGSNNGFMGMGMQSIPDLMVGGSAAMRLPTGIMGGGLDDGLGGEGVAIDRGALLELGLAAMEELVKVTQVDDPLWQPSLDIGLETLNFDEYRRAFARVLGPSPAGYVSEATREVGIAIINSVDLVNSLMNEVRIAVNMDTSGASCRNTRANRCNAAGSVVGDVPVRGGEGEHDGDHLERHGRHPQRLNPTDARGAAGAVAAGADQGGDVPTLLQAARRRAVGHRGRVGGRRPPPRLRHRRRPGRVHGLPPPPLRLHRRGHAERLRQGHVGGSRRVRRGGGARAVPPAAPLRPGAGRAPLARLAAAPVRVPRHPLLQPAPQPRRPPRAHLAGGAPLHAQAGAADG